MRVMVTGAAGFIGSHLTQRLLAEGMSVVRVDCLADYYSPELKVMRQSLVDGLSQIDDLVEANLSDPRSLASVSGDIDAIIHLAAQPGVRLQPAQFDRYVEANLVGLNTVFAFAAQRGVPHVLYASSSSVYGDGTPTPFVETAQSLSPTSFYGSTKLAGEEIARAYCQATPVSARGLRYFTVYGPWGRPDMAYFRLLAAALGEWEFTLTGASSIRRDFTYVDDTVTSTVALLRDLTRVKPRHHDVVNVGGGQSRTMSDLISAVESISGKSLSITQGASVDADMAATEADFGFLQQLTGQHPQISLEEGLERCLSWASRDDIKPRLRTWIESTQ